MALKKPTGDMYPFIDWIWNPVCGKCSHDCSYCYVKRISNQYNIEQKKPHLVLPELRTSLKINSLIFVCSGCDLFANDVPDEYIHTVVERTNEWQKALNANNRYIFQTKNPKRITTSSFRLSAKIHKICTTIETDRYYNEMGKTPSVNERVMAMLELSNMGFETMVTIEPVMDFSPKRLLHLIKMTNAVQVNIGADSNPKKNNLPEPPKEKLIELISELGKFTKVVQKENLGRLLA